jgi:hypothetical protein
VADRADLLRKIGKGAAAEGALNYLGELLDQLYRDAANAVENAKGDEALREARADFRAARRLLRRIGFDIKDGRVAEKILEQSGG